MNDGVHAMRRQRRAWPRQARTAAAAIATAVLALLTAACSSGSPSSAGSGAAPTAGGTTGPPSAVAYSACMRSRGVPDFPDPASGGGFPKKTPQQLGVSSSQYQAATQACGRLLPNGGNGMTQSQVQQMTARALRYARCMRAHGVANFPDPGSDGHYPDPLEHRAENSPQFPAASRTCDRLVPGPSASSSRGGGS